MRQVLIPLILGVLVGCARYEYDVVSPPDVAGHVGTAVDRVLPLDPLEYRLRAVDNRLVVRIYNRTPQSIALLGDRSWVVDPEGQSHPLASKTLPPDSFVKLIFPPPRPRLYRGGPSIGIGVGGRIGRRDEEDFEPRPLYLSAADVDAAEMEYWDWKGTGEIRLHVLYAHADGDEPGPSTITHDLVIRRVRAN